MCRNKSEGGRRCLGHARAAFESQQERVRHWEEEVRKRTEVVKATPSSRTRRDLRTASQRVKVERERLLTVRAEVAEIEARAQQREQARQARAAEAEARRKSRPKGRSFAWLSAALSDEEWDLVADDASAHGHTRQYARETRPNVSAFVRLAISRMPAIGTAAAVSFDDRPLTQNKAHHGRHPSRTGSRREAQTIAISSEDATRLEEEAALFGLSRSDYVRCLLIGRDPRKPGGHEGRDAYRARRDDLARLEQGMTEGGMSLADFYAGQVRDARVRAAGLPVGETRHEEPSGNSESVTPPEQEVRAPEDVLAELRARRQARNEARREQREAQGKAVPKPVFLDPRGFYSKSSFTEVVDEEEAS